MCDDNDEPTIPRAALNKLIKDNAPHIRVANETRDLVHTCCLEFVKLVAAEANRICVHEQRKTVSHEHAVKALDQLGFGLAYQEAATSVLDQCKEAAQKRLKRLNSRLEKCGVPVEELQKQQEQLFEKARLEQAELEQSQTAWFYQQRELAARQQQQNLHNQSISDQVTTSVKSENHVISGQSGRTSLGQPDHVNAASHSAAETALYHPTTASPSYAQYSGTNDIPRPAVNKLIPSRTVVDDIYQKPSVNNDIPLKSTCTNSSSNQISVITMSSTTISSPPVSKKPKKFSELDEDYDNPE